jgi:hypothetical protein
MLSATAALSLPRTLQAQGSVSAGGGGAAKLYYSSSVNSVAGESATADQKGTGSVMGMGFGSIRGPDGMASAGGYGGGNISGGFALTAFNGASGNAIGGGQIGGFGGGTGTFVPGQNSQAIMQQAKGEEVTGPSGITGGGGTAIAFALGLGAANLTAPGTGEFAAANATGQSLSFGRGYGQGSNSDGFAGGNAVSDAEGGGGGAAEAGNAPKEGVASTMIGGITQFIGIGSGAASNLGSGYFGVINVNQKFVPYSPSFVIPKFPDNPGGLFPVATP